MYRKAYDYLNDSIIKVKYEDDKSLRISCKQYVRGAKLKFDNDLQVASKFIKNDRGFPLCDLLKSKYNVTESCVYAIGSGEFKLTKQVQDSLKMFWRDYQIKNNSEIEMPLKEIMSKRKDGHVVFFSDIYKNTLAAEVKSFCLPYDEVTWFGSSTSFYFIFNQQGEIEQVYSGITIHYN